MPASLSTMSRPPIAALRLAASRCGGRPAVYGKEEITMSAIVSREIRLKNRPASLPREDDFELVEVSIPALNEGDMLVCNHYMSVDPYMRGRMYDRASYVTPFQLGQPLDGGCVGQVIEVRGSTLFQTGDYVSSRQGWREYYISDGSDLTKIDPDLVPLQAYLGTMGMPGMTAYVGLLDIGKPKTGETVFVSAAAGAVGMVVCQIAKIKGCRVVGSAGSTAKVQWLRDVAGIDAALNYKTVASLTDEVGRHCPDGIDIYFENVGGAHLEAAIEHMNMFGRIPLCGMISQYNEAVPAGPGNLRFAVRKRLTMQGFIVSDHVDRQSRFHADMAALFTGDNLGKMLIKL
jgi:NADPH-dependent curcumin reductase CurA